MKKIVAAAVIMVLLGLAWVPLGRGAEMSDWQNINFTLLPTRKAKLPGYDRTRESGYQKIRDLAQKISNCAQCSAR